MSPLCFGVGDACLQGFSFQEVVWLLIKEVDHEIFYFILFYKSIVTMRKEDLNLGRLFA